MNHKTLVLAIPTYNRYEQLSHNLETIFTHIPREVGVFVSDNHSPDPRIPALLEQYKHKFDNFDFIVQERNVGADANFLSAVLSPDADYVWLNGDDDIILSGVDKVLSFLNESNGRFDFIDVFSKITKDYHHNELFQFLAEWRQCVTFMTGMVYKSSLAKQVNNPERFIGTYFLQSHLALQSIAKGEGSLAFVDGVSYEYGYLYKEEMRGYDIYEVFIKQMRDIYFVSGIEAGLTRKQAKALFGLTIPFLCGQTQRVRSQNPKKARHPLRYLRFLVPYSRAWKSLFPRMLMPRGIIKRIYMK